MTPFTIHYRVAIWSFTILLIRPLPTSLLLIRPFLPSLPSLPFLSTLLIFIPSIDWIMWSKRYGRRPMSTNPVAIAIKPHGF